MRENGYSDSAINTLWDILVPFSDYAFNKAHSAAYGLVSYWTAYLKANYPAEYMAALLTSVAGDKDKSALYLNECRRMGITVLPPDVNASAATFTPVGGDIRFGLAAVRNVGTAVVDAIVASRTTESEVEAVLVERLLQPLRLPHIGVYRRAVREWIDAPLDRFRVDVHQQLQAELARHLVSKRDHLAELPRGVDVQQLERRLRRVEGLHRQVQHHRAVLADRIQHHRVLGIGHRFAQDIDALGFEPLQVGQRDGRAGHFGELGFGGRQDGRHQRSNATL